MHRPEPIDASYILPIRVATPVSDGELSEYLRWLAQRVEVIVVDGSAPSVFAAHARMWGDVVHHLPPAADLATPMGKVGGVLTGVRVASHERLIVADDDVRYDDVSLGRVADALLSADVVRPQNYFTPLPWHARWDTGRMLLNRMTGGDWPGTLGVRRSILRATGGYDGSVMFENLELVRTVLAAGGREAVLLDVFVARRPSTVAHFWSQRVRQAYDEIARPARLAVQAAVLPIVIVLMATGHWIALLAAGAVVVCVAEVGRWRSGGRRVFPASASLLAPAWLMERTICAWLALGARIALGGVPYRGVVLRHAATPMRVLRQRHDATAAAASSRPPHESRRRWA